MLWSGYIGFTGNADSYIGHRFTFAALLVVVTCINSTFSLMAPIFPQAGLSTPASTPKQFSHIANLCSRACLQIHDHSDSVFGCERDKYPLSWRKGMLYAYVKQSPNMKLSPAYLLYLRVIKALTSCEAHAISASNVGKWWAGAGKTAYSLLTSWDPVTADTVRDVRRKSFKRDLRFLRGFLQHNHSILLTNHARWEVSRPGALLEGHCGDWWSPA